MADERTKQQLLNRRTTLVASLERTARFVENYSAERDAGQVQLRLENLNTVWTGLENVQIQLEDLEDTSEGMTNNLQFRSDNETRFFQVKATLQSYLPVVSSTSASSQSTYSGLSAIKLPTISLPEFDGDYNQWLTFHDTFSALIHDNAEVPAIQKFHYLRAALKGEAAQLIESIGISSANYSIAWQTLISRYANDYLLKKRHLQALLDCPRMNTESATALHTIVDDYERHTKTLRQLGEPIDAWSTMLEHLLCQRLDDGTLKAWETFATTTENPDFNCLIGFLQKRIRVLESMSVNHQSHPVSNHPPPVFRRSPFNRTSTYAVAEMNQYKCHACDEHHFLFQCPQFGAMSLSERMNLVNEQRLCHNCFNQNHIVRNCQSKFSCRHCKRRHHSMLHPGYHPNSHEQIPTTSHAMATPPAQEDVGSIVHTATASHTTTNPFCALAPQSNANVLLSTVVVLIVDSSGEVHPARALLDNGSQTNIISERLCQILRLKRKKINIPVFGVGQASFNVRHSVIANIKSRMNNFETDLEFLVMPHITIDLPATVAHRNKWNPPRNCFLADPTFDKTGAIDMLLGAEHFFNFVNSGNKIESAGNPTLIESVFGWIVTGRNQSQLVSYPAICHLAVKDTLSEALEKFWLIEEIESKKYCSAEEQECEDHYSANVTRTTEGRYVVRLPRQSNFDHMLGESKAAALRRFHYLEKKLEREPELKNQYHSFMSEYLSLGHMRPVSSEESEPNHVHYLPHHAVLKDSSTTTKLRVVFDGSAKTSTGYSINDALQTGPIVQDELLTLILRFRKYAIALVADIEKMYRQVLVHSEDTSLQRILWRFRHDEPLRAYELLTVTYGLTPSSFLATRTLEQLASDEGKNFPLGGPALRKNFYVDDYIGGAETVEDAIQTRLELDQLLTKGGFQLRKWTSNNPKVLESIDPSHIGTMPTLQFDVGQTTKALGVSWEPSTDKLLFHSTLTHRDHPLTKRAILSSVSKHFDPLGLTAPVVIRAKMLLQELWLQPCGWDDEVSDNIQRKWNYYHADLCKISAFKVDRCVFLPNSTIQFHTFSDASQQAYGACVYARSIDSAGHVYVQLVAAKSRVAPLKRLSIPRLELSSAVLASKLHKRVINALEMSNVESYFWSDSTVTLEWLRSPPYVWNTFVANRVSEIQTNTEKCQWKHVAGKQNPADLITRGMGVDDFLTSELWHYGPIWLKSPEAAWPISKLMQISTEDVPERRKMVAAVQQISRVNVMFEISSSYHRLLRVTAYCLRFIQACRTRVTSRQAEAIKHLTVDEISMALTKLVQLAQTDGFAEELKELEKGTPVSRRSPLCLLSPFIDSNRVIRVGGRLRLSEQPYLIKHPILLPSAHPFTRLIIRHFHEKLLHGGGRATLSALRQEYWPIQGYRTVKSVIRKCFRCTRADSVPAKQKTGQLPLQRITPTRPFTVTGVDYAGPIYLKPIHKRAGASKAYISIFICFVTKAVHIELVSDLSTAAFLAALRRFIARRGCPTHMHSDNGKNFEGARNELYALYQHLHDEDFMQQVSEICANKRIHWHMNPPKAPHFGGLWEAAVKIAKRHLHRQLGNAMLSFEDMTTVLTEIEAAMNSRPLTPLTEDPNDLSVLTPAHFLTGESLSVLPVPDYSTYPINRLNHYQRLQQRVQQFWHQWKTEYLQELQKENRHIAPSTAFQPGRMVVIVDEFIAPVKWPLARIVTTYPGVDGLTRVVDLRTSKGMIRRPITKICLLPYEEENEQQL
ncbi:uncharacterized protein LOC128745882 [Sabethes cyaneus]|uniref:uncharacterized protein LOC128745882 n=1 Tax=Sabethes cyaneus TaxID=53552 RepID=UPI00237EB696|nr:uncharacterized protein LOC128745882 [Sabethes cyaneus]